MLVRSSEMVLGKKFYKSLIYKYKYISSNYSIGNPTIESDMVWESLTKDNELFTFAEGDNLISFFHTVDYEIIMEKLEGFFQTKDNSVPHVVDTTFKEKYDISKTFLINL